MVGHEAAIKETARYTDKRKKLDVYFKPDTTKRSGEYVSRIGFIKKIDSYNLEVLFADGAIEIKDIYSIDF